MNKHYLGLNTIPLSIESEEGFLAGSKVDEIKMEVEVDEYIKIEEMTVSFE